MCTIYGVIGADKLGREVIIRAQNILLDKGFYDPRLSSQIYGDMTSKLARKRAIIAWGVLDYVT
jgi:hypothetical protein